MIRRFLIDTNVVLDVLLDRKPFVDDARAIWELSDAGTFDASVAAFSLPTIHYVCRRHAGIAAANNAVDICLQAFEVCALYRECVLAARRMAGGEFEDNLQIASAITDFMQGIVTRNKADFIESPLPVYSPGEFLQLVRR
jgi:predicted nucleic acid-binding protein